MASAENNLHPRSLYSEEVLFDGALYIARGLGTVAVIEKEREEDWFAISRIPPEEDGDLSIIPYVLGATVQYQRHTSCQIEDRIYERRISDPLPPLPSLYEATISNKLRYWKIEPSIFDEDRLIMTLVQMANIVFSHQQYQALTAATQAKCIETR